MFDPPMDNAPPEASANIEELASELRARIRQDKAFVHDADQLTAFSLMLGALDATSARLAEVEAKRAMLERAVLDAALAVTLEIIDEPRHTKDEQTGARLVNVALRQQWPAIVARLLPPTGDEAKKGAE